VEELLAERGIEVDHVTCIGGCRPWRRSSSIARVRNATPGDSWFVDETHIKPLRTHRRTAHPRATARRVRRARAAPVIKTDAGRGDDTTAFDKSTQQTRRTETHHGGGIGECPAPLDGWQVGFRRRLKVGLPGLLLARRWARGRSRGRTRGVERRGAALLRGLGWTGL